MTINDKHQGSSEKHLEGQKSGDQQVAGKPIADKHDNAQQQRLEQQTAIKAFRFTKDGGNAFTIDMGDGKAAVQDKRPLQDDAADGSRDLVPARMYPKTGKTEELGKDGKWHKMGSIPASQEAHVGEYQQGKDGEWHKTEHKTSHQTDGAHTTGEQKHEQHDQSGKRELTGERGWESQMRPHPEDRTYNEKDHLWHDKKNGKVVEPPDSKQYGAGGALYNADMLLYRAYQITHPLEQ
jgi:hypothetical protein